MSENHQQPGFYTMDIDNICIDSDAAHTYDTLVISLRQDMELEQPPSGLTMSILDNALNYGYAFADRRSSKEQPTRNKLGMLLKLITIACMKGSRIMFLLLIRDSRIEMLENRRDLIRLAGKTRKAMKPFVIDNIRERLNVLRPPPNKTKLHFNRISASGCVNLFH